MVIEIEKKKNIQPGAANLKEKSSKMVQRTQVLYAMLFTMSLETGASQPGITNQKKTSVS